MDNKYRELINYLLQHDNWDNELREKFLKKLITLSMPEI